MAQGQTAILVSASPKSKAEQEERLAELAELASSADLTVIDRLVQRTQSGHHRFQLGSGKLKDVLMQAMQKGTDLLIFDQDLAPAQLRAIAEITDLTVIDRTQLILDIFAQRAHSREGKVQVELAQLRYLLPRLSGQGTSLSRLGGGIGSRGPVKRSSKRTAVASESASTIWSGRSRALPVTKTNGEHAASDRPSQSCPSWATQTPASRHCSTS